MTVSSRVEVTLRTVAVVGATARTVVAIPPSNADEFSDQMRVAVNGTVTLRPFDPGEPIITGAPVAYVTTSGEPYVTMAGEPYVLVVG